MNKLIKEFLEKLNVEGVFSDEQIKEFEKLGEAVDAVVISAKQQTEAELTEKFEKEIKELTEQHETDQAEIMTQLGEAIEKMNSIKSAEIKHELIKYKEHIDLTTRETEIVEQLSKYLKESIESHIPSKPVVDYAELSRLRGLFNHIKEAVMISETDIQDKVSSVIENIESDLTKTTESLNEAIARNIEYKSQIDSITASTLLEEKIKDLPEFEQDKLRKEFKESTSDEIEEGFQASLDVIREKYREDDTPPNTLEIKEDNEEDEDASFNDIDRYAKLAERWIPQN
jgi:galactitol-specific phosphotransferase system IIB component